MSIPCYTSSITKRGYMAHIHEKIDFTVSAYIVHPDLSKVLLVHHKKQNRWQQIGGHVELDEDTDKALEREIEEECGIEVEVLPKKIGKSDDRSKALRRPDFVVMYKLDSPKGHFHLDLSYVVIAKTAEPALAAREHNDIRWFSRHDLYTAEYGISDSDRWYCLEAIKMAKEHRKNS